MLYIDLADFASNRYSILSLISLFERFNVADIRRTYGTFHLRYYIPRISRIIKQYVNECTETSKLSDESPFGLLYPIPREDLFHTLSLDFNTDLPLSQGKDALLTVTEKFTKAARLVPCMKDTDAEERRDYISFIATRYSV